MFLMSFVVVERFRPFERYKIEEPFATLVDIVIRFIEVARIPRIGNVTRAVGKGAKFVNFITRRTR